MPDPGNPCAALAAAIDIAVERPCSLEDMAAASGMDPARFDDLFTRWAGIGARDFARHADSGRVRHALHTAPDAFPPAAERYHEVTVAQPGDLTIRWGLHDSPYGRALLSAAPRGLCWLSFVIDGNEERAVEIFRTEWRSAAAIHDPAATSGLAADIFSFGPPVPLVLCGTPFQVAVWLALLRIPAGRVACYQDLAEAVGRPDAPRAVGAAVGRNPVSLVVPCHRMVLKSGVAHNYRWGVRCKKALLALEAARAAATQPAFRQPASEAAKSRMTWK